MRGALASLLSALLIAGAAAAAQVETPGAASIGDQPPIYVPGTGAAPFVPPTPAYYMTLGHSQMANGYNTKKGSGSTFALGWQIANNVASWISPSIDDIILDSPSGDYAQGSSTTARYFGSLTQNIGAYPTTPYGALFDYGSVSANIATSGNPGGNATPGGSGVSVDAYLNPNAQGVYAPCNDPANIAFYIEFTNDFGNAHYSGVSPYPIQIMTETAAILDELHTTCGSTGLVFVLDTPEGYSTVWQEKHTVSANSITATNTSGFVDGDSFMTAAVEDQNNNILSKVSSGPANGQYSVTTGGVYTFSATSTPLAAPTTATITYSYGAGNTANTGVALASKTLDEWIQSSASSFTSTEYGTAYSIPGLLYNRPWVIPISCFGALVDPATATGNKLTDTFNAKKGYLDTLHLHLQTAAAQKCGDLIHSTVLAEYPALKTLADWPTFGSYGPCTTNGVATTYSSTACPGAGTFTLPSLMRGSQCLAGAANGTFKVYIKGVLAAQAKSDGSGFNSAGSFTVTASSLNCTTGAWSITFSAAPANSQAFAIYEDATNAIPNALLDASWGTQGAVATNVTLASGVTGMPNGWSLTVDSCTAAALASGHTTITVNTSAGTSPASLTDADGTWPAITVTVWSDGQQTTSCTAGGSGAITIAGSVPQPAAPTGNSFFPLTQGFRAGVEVQIDAGANGHLYGLASANVLGDLAAAAAFTAATYSGDSSGVWGTTTGTIMQVTANSNSSLDPFSDLNLYNGAFQMRALTPRMDLQGVANASTYISQAFVDMIVGYGEEVPVSAKVTFARPQMRSVSK